jgi:hypothetical protein
MISGKNRSMSRIGNSFTVTLLELNATKYPGHTILE